MSSESAVTGDTFKSAVAALLLLSLSACTQVPDLGPPKPAFETVYRGLAIDAVNRMRETFNRGGCQSIYDEASDGFRQLESQQDWLSECEQMRINLGTWASFNARAADIRQSFLAHVDGRAVFAKGAYRLRTTWNLEGGRARLFSMDLQGGDRRTVIPAPFIPRQPLMDPLPRQSGCTSRSAGTAEKLLGLKECC